MVYQDGGWRVLVNGEVQPAEREPGVFLSAELPEGKSRVDVLYRPAGFLWGCVIAAVGLAVGVAFFLPMQSQLSCRPARASMPGLRINQKAG